MSSASQPDSHQPNSNGVCNIFFKTRCCAKFRAAGFCLYGSNCKFAHGSEELRNPPPNWKEIVASYGVDGMGNSNEDKSIVKKMKLCKRFCNGEECHYGEKCNFLHDYPLKYRKDSGRFVKKESSVTSIIGTPLNGSSGSEQQDQKEMQKLGGCYDVEMASAGTTSSKPFPTSKNDVSSSVPSSKEELLLKRNKFLSRGIHKINGIYGDWIGDLPPAQERNQ